MNHIVRRTPQTPAVAETANHLPTRSHCGENMMVASQLSLGVEPRLTLAWRIEPWCWVDGYTLLVFRSTTGFCPEKYPVDLNRHGQLIIETKEDASVEQVPEEGTHFFTFVLHKKVLLGLSEKISILRFSETVPSARVAIGRIRDQIDLQDMLQRREVDEIEHGAKINEANVRFIRSRRSLEEAENPQPQRKPRSTAAALIAEKLESIDAMVEAIFAKRMKVSELRKDPRFRKLSREERQAVLDRIDECLDPAEISAAKEIRES